MCLEAGVPKVLLCLCLLQAHQSSPQGRGTPRIYTWQDSSCEKAGHVQKEAIYYGAKMQSWVGDISLHDH